MGGGIQAAGDDWGHQSSAWGEAMWILMSVVVRACRLRRATGLGYYVFFSFHSYNTSGVVSSWGLQEQS